MALNAASHNATAEPTGSPSGPPPPVSDDVTSVLKEASKKDSLGQNDAGKDEKGNDEEQYVMGESGKEKIAEEVHQG